MVYVLFEVVEVLVFRKLFLALLFSLELSLLADTAALGTASPVFVVKSLTSPAEVLFTLRTDQMVTTNVFLDRIATLRIGTWFHKIHDVRISIRLTLNLLDPGHRILTGCDGLGQED